VFIYVYMFIELITDTYMNIYVFIVFKKRMRRGDKPVKVLRSGVMASGQVASSLQLRRGEGT
jgi:hypothetical protein